VRRWNPIFAMIGGFMSSSRGSMLLRTNSHTMGSSVGHTCTDTAAAAATTQQQQQHRYGDCTGRVYHTAMHCTGPCKCRRT
jgi:hypothetical protein